MDEQLMDEVPKTSRMPLLIASVVCLLLGTGAGYGASEYLGSSSEAAAAVSTADPEAGPTATVPLGEFTVNLRNTAGGRMLQMSISALVTETAVEQFNESQAQMRDAVLVMASDKTVAELDGGDNKIDFRNDVLTRLNGVLGTEAVRAVYLTRFVVQ
jgi:flagellar FliL protein